MVSLGGEDAGGGGEDILVLDERRGAVVGGDTGVLEQEGAEQEEGVARVLPSQQGDRGSADGPARTCRWRR